MIDIRDPRAWVLDCGTFAVVLDRTHVFRQVERILLHAAPCATASCGHRIEDHPNDAECSVPACACALYTFSRRPVTVDEMASGTYPRATCGAIAAKALTVLEDALPPALALAQQETLHKAMAAAMVIIAGAMASQPNTNGGPIDMREATASVEDIFARPELKDVREMLIGFAETNARGTMPKPPKSIDYVAIYRAVESERERLGRRRGSLDAALAAVALDRELHLDTAKTYYKRGKKEGAAKGVQQTTACP